MTFFSILIAGIVACAAMDVWQRAVSAAMRTPPNNWSVVGRWSYEVVTRKMLFNADIENRPALEFEIPLGWVVHYGVGFGYAVVYWLLAKMGLLGFTWIDGLIFGIASVVVPWLFFLPALGKGVFACNTPKPAVTCTLAFLTHAIFGVAMALGFALTM